MDCETAAQMLPVVLPGGRFVEPFCLFLTEGQLAFKEQWKKINADQWIK